MKFFHGVLFLALMVLLAACASATPTPAPNSATATPVDSGYPAPQPPANPYPAAVNGSSYPAPQTQPTELAVPSVTPDSTKAMVKGVYFVNGKPVANQILFLARVLKDSAGKEITLSLDKNTAPSVLTDSNGNFVFMNVPVDTYGLIQDSGTSSFALSKPGSPDEQMRVVVTSNQPVDVGKLDYPAP